MRTSGSYVLGKRHASSGGKRRLLHAGLAIGSWVDQQINCRWRYQIIPPACLRREPIKRGRYGIGTIRSREP